VNITILVENVIGRNTDEDDRVDNVKLILYGTLKLILEKHSARMRAGFESIEVTR
jgi:hypothetical protein